MTRKPLLTLLALGFVACGSGNSNDNSVLVPDDRGAPRVLQTFAKSFGGALDDEATALAVAADGGLLIAGQMSRGASADPQRTVPWLARLDSAGEVLWQTGLFNPASEQNAQLIDSPRLFATLPDGGMLIATTSYHARTAEDVALMRIDAANQLVWMTHIDSGTWATGYAYYPRERPTSARDFPEAIFVAPGHGIYVVTHSAADVIDTNVPGAIATTNAYSVSVSFVSEDGNLRWTAPRLIEHPGPLGGAVTPAGHLVLQKGSIVVEYAPDRIEIGRDEWHSSGMQFLNAVDFLQPVAGTEAAFDGIVGYVNDSLGAERGIYKIDVDLGQGWRTGVDTAVTALRQICTRNTAERRCDIWFATRSISRQDTANLFRLDESGSLVDAAATCNVPGLVLDIALLGSTTNPQGMRLLVQRADRPSADPSTAELQDVGFDCAPLAPAVSVAEPIEMLRLGVPARPFPRLLPGGGAQIGGSVFSADGTLAFRAATQFGVGDSVTSVALGADAESAALLADGRLVTLDASGFATRAYRLFDAPDPEAQLASDEQGRYWVAGANDMYRITTDGIVQRVTWEAGVVPLHERRLHIAANGVAYLQARGVHARFESTSDGLVMRVFASDAIHSSLLRNGDLALVTRGDDRNLRLERVSSSGDFLVWSRELRLPSLLGDTRPGESPGAVRGIAGTGDGGLVIAFNAWHWWAREMGMRSDESLPDASDLALLKVNGDGHAQWLRVYGGVRDERWSQLAARGNRIAMLATSGSFDAVTPASREVWTLGTGPDGHVTFDVSARRELCQACLGDLTGDYLNNFVFGSAEVGVAVFHEGILAWEGVDARLETPPQTELTSSNTARQCAGEATDVQESAAIGGTPPDDFELFVTTHGAATSRVAGAGIDCGADCSERIEAGIFLTLTAFVGVGERFVQWSGCDLASERTCTVHMDRARSVDAFFEVTSVGTPQDFELTVGSDGAAPNTRLTALGIDCGEDCAQSYAAGVAVIVTAQLDPGYVVETWVGCDSYTRDTCTVQMRSHRSVLVQVGAEADFRLLHVARRGAGSGVIEGERVTCTADYGCNGFYPPGESVVLRPVADEGSVFLGWGNCPIQGPFGACTITMNEHRFLSAMFSRPGQARLTVLRHGPGAGNVRITSETPGIDCGVDCIEDYPQYTRVRLRVAGVSLPPAEWRNCDSVLVDGSCEMEVASDRSVELFVP